jgi:hypothetical protein
MGSSKTVPVIPPPDDGVVLWLLKRRHEDLGTMFRAVWDNYIKFYTVFLIFSVTALGWLLSRAGTETLPVKIDHVVAIVFYRSERPHVNNERCHCDLLTKGSPRICPVGKDTPCCNTGASRSHWHRDYSRQAGDVGRMGERHGDAWDELCMALCRFS